MKTINISYGGMMSKKTTIPEMLLYIRVALLIAIVVSLCLKLNYLFAVLFITVEIFDVCDIVLAMRSPANYSTLGIYSNTAARILFVAPLLYLTIIKRLTIWVFLILLFFEIVIGLYKTFAGAFGKRRITLDVLYCLYSLSLWLSIIVSMFFPKLGTIIVFVASAFGAVFIIYASIVIGDDGEEEIPVVDGTSEIEQQINEEEDEILE